MPIDLSLYLAFVLAATLVCLLPGPDMLFILASGLQDGTRGAVVAATGIAGGMVVHTAAAVIGLSALLRSSAAAFEVIRWAGALYLLLLAISAWRTPLEIGSQAGRRPERTRRRIFVQAATTNLLNPKIVVFYLAFLPQFVDEERGGLGLQLLILGLSFAVVGYAVDLLVAVASGALRRALQRFSRAGKWLHRTASVLYVGLAARVLATD